MTIPSKIDEKSVDYTNNAKILYRFDYKENVIETIQNVIFILFLISVTYQISSYYKLISIFPLKYFIDHTSYMVILYQTLKIFLGWVIHPHSIPIFKIIKTTNKKNILKILNDNTNTLKYKFTYINVNHINIDTLIINNMKAKNDRWMIVSINRDYTRDKQFNEYIDLAKTIKTNIIFYNLPAIGNSTGIFITKHSAIRSHRAIHGLLQELKAKEVIDFASCTGCGIQGESINISNFNRYENLILVRYKTFSSLSQVAHYSILSFIASAAIKIFDFDYISTIKSISTKTKEIVFQSGIIKKDKTLESSHLICFDQAKEIDETNRSKVEFLSDDGQIQECATLGKSIINNGTIRAKTKLYIVPPTKNQKLDNHCKTPIIKALQK